MMNHVVSRRRFLQTTSALGAGLGLFGLPATARDAAGAARGAPHAEKLGWRLACNAYTYNKLTFYETIDKVAGLGLKYVVGFNWQKLDPKRPAAVFNEQLSAADRRETKKRLGDAGLALTCCYCRNLADEEGCRRLFGFAREMGMETLDGEPPPPAFDMLEKLCGEYGLNVAVHNHAKPSPYWNPDTLMKLFRGRSKRIGACCDTGHWGRSGLNPIEMLRKLEGRILTFDLKDVNDVGRCVPFGKGECDIRGILTELRRQRFRGVLGIEYPQRSPGSDARVAECVVYFEKVARELAAT
jgi:sugar phosphate isomerase/epimerase